MDLNRIYRYTSVARPLDPAYATNKAVLLLIPVGAVLSALLFFADIGSAETAAAAAFNASLVIFVSWALTREIVPDDNPAAFISMAIAYAAHLVLGPTSVLVSFVAMMLVRIVNRSTGRAATPVDTVLVLGFALWTMWTLDQPLLGMIAAATFGLDAHLSGGGARHYLAAIVAAIASGWALVENGTSLRFFTDAGPVYPIAAAAISVAFLLTVVTLRTVVSIGDVSTEPLQAARCRAGMLIAWLVALQSLVPGADRSAELNPTLWACLLGAVLGVLARRSGLVPAMGGTPRD